MDSGAAFLFLSVKGFDGVVVDDVEDFASLLREPVEEHVEPARHGGEHRVDVGIGRLFARILDHGADVPAAPDILGYDVGLDFLHRLKAGDSYSASLMGHRGSAGSRFTGDRVAAGLGQPPSHIASTGV